jgi:hypothetical protein
MVKNCQQCGAFTSDTKPGTVIIEVAEDFRKKRPDVPKHLFLCPKHASYIEKIKTFEWYAGHRVV